MGIRRVLVVGARMSFVAVAGDNQRISARVGETFSPSSSD